MDTKFEKFIQTLVRNSEQVTYKKDGYNRAANIIAPTEIINSEVMQNSINNINSLNIDSGANNEVSWGADGLTLTDTSKPIGRGSYSQIKLTGGGIFISNSLDGLGNRIWNLAISSKGLNTSNMASGTIDMSQIRITNVDQPRFVWNEDGLVAYAYNSTGITDFNTYVKYNINGLEYKNSTGSVLTMNWDGLYIGIQDDAVRLTSKHGLQVFDDQATPHERIAIGRFYTGETPDTPQMYGIRLKDAAGNITLYTDTTGKLCLNDVLMVGSAGDDSVGLTSEYDNNDSVRIWAGGDRSIAWGETGAPHFMVTKEGTVYVTNLIGGHQVPSGGTVGQTLIKTSNADYDINWGMTFEDNAILALAYAVAL